MSTLCVDLSGSALKRGSLSSRKVDYGLTRLEGLITDFHAGTSF